MKLNTESKDDMQQEKKVNFHDVYRQDFIGYIYNLDNDIIFEIKDNSMEEVIKKIENQLTTTNNFAYVKIVARLFKKKNNLILQENYHYFYKDEVDNLLENEIKKRKE